MFQIDEECSSMLYTDLISVACAFLVYLFDVYFKNRCDEHISGWLNLVYPIQLFNSMITIKWIGWVKYILKDN